MEWMIASDSSCEIRTLPDTAPGVQFALVPFKIRVGEREFVDLPTLNTKAMLQAMTDYNGASTTACPSPEEWAELFLMADESIALTISRNLSGSYNTSGEIEVPVKMLVTRARWCWKNTPKSRFLCWIP